MEVTHLCVSLHLWQKHSLPEGRPHIAPMHALQRHPLSPFPSPPLPCSLLTIKWQQLWKETPLLKDRDVSVQQVLISPQVELSAEEAVSLKGNTTGRKTRDTEQGNGIEIAFYDQYEN